MFLAADPDSIGSVYPDGVSGSKHAKKPSTIESKVKKFEVLRVLFGGLEAALS
jgi:hypothetical protein